MEKAIERFFCWPDGYNQEGSKMIKADSVKEAAKMAVEAWKHEDFIDIRLPELLVNVKDSNEKIHRVYVNQETYLDSSGPVA